MKKRSILRLCGANTLGRRRTSLMLVLFALGVLLTACGRGSDELPATVSTQSLKAILGVAFLPPIDKPGKASGKPDQDVGVSIAIFNLVAGQAVGEPVGPNFSREDGTIKIAGNHFHANWKTSDSALPDGAKVRVELRLANAPENAPACNVSTLEALSSTRVASERKRGVFNRHSRHHDAHEAEDIDAEDKARGDDSELGQQTVSGISADKGCIAFVDVQLWKNKGDVKKKGGDKDSLLDLKNGQTLPIKFHVIPGAANVTPVITIQEPAETVEITDADTLTLSGKALDLEEGDLSAQIVWTSSLSGELGTGASLSQQLPLGTHKITAEATDTNGATGRVSVTVEVVSPKPDATLLVSGSAPCSLDVNGGPFTTNLAFQDGNGNPLESLFGAENVRFTQINVLAAETDNVLSAATLTPERILSQAGEGDAASILILLDESGSITGFDRQRLRFEAARGLIERMRPGDEVAIATFGFRTLLQGFTDDKEALSAALDRVPGSNSNVYSSIQSAVKAFDEASNSLKAIVVITDGEAVGDEINFSAAINDANEANIQIYPIGIRPGNEARSKVPFQLLRWAACQTGGVFNSIDKPDAIEAVFAALSDRLLTSGTNLEAELLLETQLPGKGQYRLSGTVEVDAEGQRASSTFDIPFDIQATLPSKPKLESLSPDQGPSTGGLRITATGQAIYGPAFLYFGDYKVNVGAGVTITELSSVAANLPAIPAYASGAVDVTIQTPFGTSEPLPFTYYPEYRPRIEQFNADTRYPNVGELVTFSWVVSDEGGDLLSCSLEVYDPNKRVWEKNAIDNCVATTSFSYPIEAFSTTRSVVLRVTDGKFTTSGSTSIIPKAVAPAPVLETLSVTEGTYLGGTEVVITGQNFVDVSSVTFGSTKAEFTVDSETRISLVTPRYYSARAANVMVTTTQGGQSNTLKYTFLYAPRVYSVTPAEGSTAGGTEVVLSGYYFTNASKVMFGEIEAQSFTVDNSRQITAVSPAGQEGTVQVVVETPGGTSENYKRAFTYTANPAPILETLSPREGTSAGGTSVVLTGENLTDVISVSFDGKSASFTQNSDTQVTVVSPTSTGLADVQVTTASGTSNILSFSYIEPPIVRSISPKEGPSTGGTKVTLFGENLFRVTEVKFGNTPAQDFRILSSTEIVATSPPGNEGAIKVSSSSSYGNSGIEFTYTKPAPSFELADFTSDVRYANIGKLVTFSWLVRGDFAEVSCLLDPGDGNGFVPVPYCSEETTTTYVYTEAGKFTARLLATGATATQTTVSVSSTGADFSEIPADDLRAQNAWAQVNNLTIFTNVKPNLSKDARVAYYSPSLKYTLVVAGVVSSETPNSDVIFAGVVEEGVALAMRYRYFRNEDKLKIVDLTTANNVVISDASNYLNGDPNQQQAAFASKLTPLESDPYLDTVSALYGLNTYSTQGRSALSSFSVQSSSGCRDCSKVLEYSRQQRQAFVTDLTWAAAGVGIAYVATLVPVPVIGQLVGGVGVAIAGVSFFRAIGSSSSWISASSKYRKCMRTTHPDFLQSGGTIAEAVPVFRSFLIKDMLYNTTLGSEPFQSLSSMQRTLKDKYERPAIEFIELISDVEVYHTEVYDLYITAQWTKGDFNLPSCPAPQ